MMMVRPLHVVLLSIEIKDYEGRDRKRRVDLVQLRVRITRLYRHLIFQRHHSADPTIQTASSSTPHSHNSANYLTSSTIDTKPDVRVSHPDDYRPPRSSPLQTESLCRLHTQKVMSLGNGALRNVAVAEIFEGFTKSNLSAIDPTKKKAIVVVLILQY